MPLMMPSRCSYCANVQSKTGDPNARCTKHAGTAPEGAPGYGKPGWEGPFLANLCGYDPSRPVPTFDEEGRRDYGALGTKYRRRQPLNEQLRAERAEFDELRWNRKRSA